MKRTKKAVGRYARRTELVTGSGRVIYDFNVLGVIHQAARRIAADRDCSISAVYERIVAAWMVKNGVLAAADVVAVTTRAMRGQKAVAAVEEGAAPV